MIRCIECGRPYRGGLTSPALLELALGEIRAHTMTLVCDLERVDSGVSRQCT